MLIYTNHTHLAAIVTIRIESTETPQAALEIGKSDYFEKTPGNNGVHDYLVDAGKELRTANNTIAIFLAVRGVS